MFNKRFVAENTILAKFNFKEDEVSHKFILELCNKINSWLYGSWPQ